MAVVGGGSGGGGGGGSVSTIRVAPKSSVLYNANSFLHLPSSPTMLIGNHYSFCRFSCNNGGLSINATV